MSHEETWITISSEYSMSQILKMLLISSKLWKKLISSTKLVQLETTGQQHSIESVSYLYESA